MTWSSIQPPSTSPQITVPFSCCVPASLVFMFLEQAKAFPPQSISTAWNILLQTFVCLILLPSGFCSMGTSLATLSKGIPLPPVHSRFYLLSFYFLHRLTTVWNFLVHCSCLFIALLHYKHDNVLFMYLWQVFAFNKYASRECVNEWMQSGW